MKCDNCKYYEWYYDHCLKWDCVVDARACHGWCFEPMKIQYDTESWRMPVNLKITKISKHISPIDLDEAGDAW